MSATGVTKVKPIDPGGGGAAHVTRFHRPHQHQHHYHQLLVPSYAIRVVGCVVVVFLVEMCFAHYIYRYSWISPIKPIQAKKSDKHLVFQNILH